MTAYRMTDLVCDGPSCDTSEQFRGTPREARAEVASAGWVHRNGKDYCDECRRYRRWEAQEKT